MRKKKLYNLKKEELVEMLERRNYQYGELANKYKELKETSDNKNNTKQ